jgi:YHS domain-containing protein
MKSLLGLVLLLALAEGCETPPSKEAIEHGWSAETSSKWGNDPVAGTLIPKQSAVRREYQGNVYYFRDDVEARAFDGNPAAYAADQEPDSKDGDSKETDHLSNAHSR